MSLRPPLQLCLCRGSFSTPTLRHHDGMLSKQNHLPKLSPSSNVAQVQMPRRTLTCRVPKASRTQQVDILNFSKAEISNAKPTSVIDPFPLRNDTLTPVLIHASRRVWTRTSEQHKHDAEPPCHKHAVQGGKQMQEKLRLTTTRSS